MQGRRQKFLLNNLSTFHISFWKCRNILDHGCLSTLSTFIHYPRHWNYQLVVTLRRRDINITSGVAYGCRPWASNWAYSAIGRMPVSDFCTMFIIAVFRVQFLLSVKMCSGTEWPVHWNYWHTLCTLEWCSYDKNALSSLNYATLLCVVAQVCDDASRNSAQPRLHGRDHTAECPTHSWLQHERQSAAIKRHQTYSLRTEASAVNCSSLTEHIQYSPVLGIISLAPYYIGLSCRRRAGPHTLGVLLR